MKAFTVRRLIESDLNRIISKFQAAHYDTKLCYDELRRKKIRALIPPRKRAGYWPVEYANKNQAVARQRLTGSNAYWKWHTDYNRRSVAETAIYRALNKMTRAGMPESVRVA